jgi:TRAP-type C4-dicarboxylate transport system permease small subunit
METRMARASKLLSTIDRVAVACSWIARAVGGIAILSMTVLITVDVIGRFIFGRPTYVATEFSGYLCVIITFIGLAFVSRKGRQIEVTIIIDRLPILMKRRLRLLTHTLALLFVLFFAYEAIDPIIFDYRIGARSLTFVHTPIWLISGFVPVGLGMLALEMFTQLLKMIFGEKYDGIEPDLKHGDL